MFPMTPIQSWAFLALVLILAGCIVHLAQRYLESSAAPQQLDEHSLPDHDEAALVTQHSEQLMIVNPLAVEDNPEDYQHSRETLAYLKALEVLPEGSDAQIQRIQNRLLSPVALVPRHEMEQRPYDYAVDGL